MAKRRKSPVASAITSPYDCPTYTRTEEDGLVIETAYDGAWMQITDREPFVMPADDLLPRNKK